MVQIPFVTLAIIVTVLGAFVWRARPDNGVNRWFLAFTVFVACWALGVGGLHSGAALDGWARFTFASASLIPAAFLSFIHFYPTPAPWPSIVFCRTVLAVALSLAALSLATPWMVYDVGLAGAVLHRSTGPLYPLFSLYFLTAWAAALAIFVSKWRAARGLARAQLQYVGAGILISGAGGMITNLLLPALTGSSRHSWIGPYFALVLVAMVGHAIIRHRLMDLRLIIGRGVAYGIITAGASAAALLVIKNTGWGGRLSQAPDAIVVGAVALIMLSTPAQAALRRIVDPYMHRGRLAYPFALHEATRRLSRLMQPPEVAEEIRDILTRAFVPDSFFLAARRNQAVPLEPLAYDRDLPADLLTIAGLITDDTTPSVIIVAPEAQAGPKITAHHELRSAGVELVIHLARRNEWLGTILLGPRRSGDAYFKQDLEFIEALAELTSIALDNSLLYRNSLQTAEYSDKLLGSLGSAVIAIDAEGIITSHNPAATALLGLPENAPGKFIAVLPPQIAWTLAFVVTDTWCPRDLEITIDHPSRGELPAIISAAALHDDADRITGALVVTTDLSTVKALERNQRRIEHLTMMARFYAGLAHEIRSPLAAISNFVSMLPDRFDDPEYRETAGRILPHEVGRIVRLADRLRLMAPSEDGKLSPVSLHSLLSDVVTLHSPAAAERHVSLSLYCERRLPMVLGDPGQLVQLFVNLIKNGIEAMPTGGSINIRCSRGPSADAVLVEVMDEGAGIDPSLQNQLFQPFFTTKAQGTGLGLAICKEIADFHRAKLRLTSKGVGRGTVATVELPIATDYEAAEAATVIAQTAKA